MEHAGREARAPSSPASRAVGRVGGDAATRCRLAYMPSAARPDELAAQEPPTRRRGVRPTLVAGPFPSALLRLRPWHYAPDGIAGRRAWLAAMRRRDVVWRTCPRRPALTSPRHRSRLPAAEQSAWCRWPGLPFTSLVVRWHRLNLSPPPHGTASFRPGALRSAGAWSLRTGRVHDIRRRTTGEQFLRHEAHGAVNVPDRPRSLADTVAGGPAVRRRDQPVLGAPAVAGDPYSQRR